MISTRGRYALRVMIDLAEHNDGSYTPLKAVAERQDISEKYLESIAKTLVQSGYLEGVRGKGGGYRLSRRTDRYTVGEILRALEGPLAPVSCLEHGEEILCDRAYDCKTLGLWRGLYKLVNDYLDGVTLEDLVRSNQPGDDYVI